jgi:hypothetical protein
MHVCPFLQAALSRKFLVRNFEPPSAFSVLGKHYDLVGVEVSLPGKEPAVHVLARCFGSGVLNDGTGRQLVILQARPTKCCGTLIILSAALD